ncbi:MAG: hypothetical protein ROO73_04470 [Roseivirga sp.]
MNKKSAWKLIAPLLMVTMTAQLWAQELSPTQWYRISTPHFNVIFRGNLGREAQRVANTLEHLYGPVSQSMDVQPRKISIVLRNQNVTSNAVIQLLPRKGTFLTFPTQDYNFLGGSEWFKAMPVHELRHVVQYAKLHQNFNQFLYWLGGEQTLATAMGLNLPPWLFEGDAVGIETALSKRGRGRIPHFSLLYKVNLLERGGFSYDKQVCTSLKDKVPDHYKIGYFMTTHLRRKYGSQVLADIFEKTTLPRCFTTAVRKTTGRSLTQIYKDTNEELKTLWQAQLQGLKTTPAQRINPRKNTDYTDYTGAQLDLQGHVIALKAGLGTATQFVVLDDHQQEYSLLVPGAIDSGAGFSVAQNQLVWVEEVPDLWKQHYSYAVIQHYNLSTKRLKTLTHKSRYGAAALSPDATKIVAIESDESYNHQLMILDAADGQVLQKLPNLNNHFYLTPRWADDGHHIVALKSAGQDTTIALINVLTGEEKALLPYSTEHIGCPIMHGQYVFYNSAYSGIDNIYAIDLKTQQRYQVTSRKYGAYNPTVAADGQWVFFNDFTKDGMDVVKMPLNPQKWIPLEEVEDRTVHYYAPLVTQEGNSDLLENIPDHTYPTQRYYPARHLLNIHSWVPEVNLDNTKREVKLTVFSEDLLETTSLKTGYVHDFKKRYGKAFVGCRYLGFYPIIELEGAIRGNYAEKITYEKELGLGLDFPLRFKRGQYTHLLSLSATGDIQRQPQSTWLTQLYQGSFSRVSKSSPRDIYPPWAQSLSINYLHTPYGGDVKGQVFTAQARLRFPGLGAHHSLSVHNLYRYVTHEKLFDSRHIAATDSYPYRYTRDLNKVGIDYAFPLCYPDWGDGYWLYVKQLRANTFYDFTYVAQPAKDTLPNTHRVGIDLLADVQPLLLPILLKVGIRYLYLPISGNERNTWGFLLQGTFIKLNNKLED